MAALPNAFGEGAFASLFLHGAMDDARADGARSGFLLFRVRGIAVRAHWLLLVALPFFAYMMAVAYFARDGVVTAAALGLGGVLAMALFASVTVHELAHSFVALRYGVRVRGILLLPIGGVSELGSAPKGGREEFAIAIAGPLSSLALGALLLALAPYSTLALWAGVINLTLGAFNLLVPAFPMDGGRVLRAILTPRFGILRATRTAARIGRATTLLLGLVGIVTLPHGLWLVLIAFFAYAAGSAEEAAVETAHVLGGLRVRDVMTTHPVALRADGTVADALRAMRATKHVSFPVIEERGGLVGVVGLDDIARVPKDEPSTLLRTVVRELVTTASPDEPAETALGRMLEARQDHIVVMDEGHLAGFVTRSDFSRLVQMALALEGARRWARPRS